MNKSLIYKRSLASRKGSLAKFKGVSHDMYSTNIPIEYAEEQVNLRESNGVLVPSITFENYFIDSLDFRYFPPFNIIMTHHTKGEENKRPNMIFLTHDRTIVYTPTPSEDGQYSYTYWDIYKDVNSYANFEIDNVVYCLFTDGDKSIMSFNGRSFEKHEVGYAFSNMCNHFMRLFASEKNDSKLYFSAVFDPYNFNVSIDEGGYINMPKENGAINQMISFNDSLIIIQERGMSKLLAGIEQQEFSMSYINIENDIIKNTAVFCMDKIVYCSMSGIGIFNGYESKIYFRELGDLFRDKKITGAYKDGKCYYALFGRSNGITTTKILIIDLVDMSYHIAENYFGDSIFGCRVNGLRTVFCYYTDDVLEKERNNSLDFILDEGCNKDMVWRSGSIDFGESGLYKMVKSVVFGGKTTINFRVVADGKNYSYVVRDDRKLTLNLKGMEFKFEIRPQGNNVSLPSPIIEYQVMENV